MPAMLILSIGVWVRHGDLERSLVAHHMGVDAMTAVFLSLIAVVCVAEQIYPANREWNYRVLSTGIVGVTKIMRDLAYLLIVTQLTTLLLRVAGNRLAPLIHSRDWWPADAPMAVKVLLAFFVVELLSYWVHRAAHRFGLLWRFHATHHVITELTGLKSLRVHPFDNLFFYVGRSVPLLFLGAGTDELAAATYLGGVLGILSHANVDLAESWLGWVVNYPRYHSVHHSAVMAESHSNFGCHTVLWDRLFGTFRSAPAGELVVGVEPVSPRSLWRELIGPFFQRAP
jgi:sterol desaturase/sphingolipid hydroxylase (fatty acid hydroxylase superfamily)